MIPEIKLLAEKKLIGQKIKTSFSDNRTYELWRNFMPVRKMILNNLTSELFSLQVYPESFSFEKFDATVIFEKWAAVEVADFGFVPDGMESFILVGGLYAVFIYKGSANEGAKAFEYIFGTWLPASDYILDNRPHFELLGEKYKNNDPESEEEIWIPIRKRIP
jgi:AraC family transcriptional regulator